MTSYRRRVVDDELNDLLAALPAVVLEGPKGVGKTATALQRAATVYELDDPAQQAVALADPGLLLRGDPPILLDEWQRVPAVEGESNAGLADYTHEVVASGYSGLRHLTGRALRAQLDGYLARIVDTDFMEMGHTVRRPQTLRRWMTAYAAATATTASYETIRDAATAGEADKPSRSTTLPYRDVLERLWIVDPVPAWTPTRNPVARLAQAPKHHLADPALAARLLGVGSDALLQGEQGGVRLPRDGTLLGHLFESLVTLSVRVYAQAAEAAVGHLRANGGRQEVDLIVERDDRRVLAIEVKLSRTVSDDDVRHLRWLQEPIGDDLLDMVVINTGPRAYRRPDGVAVVPAVLLGP